MSNKKSTQCAGRLDERRGEPGLRTLMARRDMLRIDRVIKLLYQQPGNNFNK